LHEKTGKSTEFDFAPKCQKKLDVAFATLCWLTCRPQKFLIIVEKFFFITNEVWFYLFFIDSWGVSQAFLSTKGFYYGRRAALALARWSAPAFLGMPRVPWNHTKDFWVRGM
jgi:hypothetical protein